MKKRVAVVLPYFGNGGAENVVSRVVSHLDLTAADVEVICVYGDPLGNKLEKMIQDHGVYIKYIRKGKGFSISAIKRLWEELSKFRPDVINTHLSACVYCIPWVLSHKVTMLHTVHNIPERELIRAKQIPMRIMYQTGKAVPIAISKEIGEQLVSYYNLKNKPEVISNPVDVKRFEIRRVTHNGTVIVNAGRLSKQKNQKLLIDIVGELSKEIKGIKLIILGDGPLKEELSSYIADTGLSGLVELKGNVDNIEEYYAQADIFALSSIYEGVPLVILEAMAAGLPVITTDVGGIKDILGEGGILIPSGDKERYIVSLRKLIQNLTARDELGKKAHRISAAYDSSVIAKRYMDIYIKYS